jgi:hypothetical protein
VLQAQFELAKEAVAVQAVGGQAAAAAAGGQDAASAEAAGTSTPLQPPVQGPSADNPSPAGSVSKAQALTHLANLPPGLRARAFALLRQQQYDLQRMQYDMRAALRAHWGEQLPAIWGQLVAVYSPPLPAQARPTGA